MEVPKGFGTVQALKKRFSSAEAIWLQWRSLHQECYDYSAPQRDTITRYAPGQRKNVHVFDSTAINGLAEFSSILQSTMVPPWREWTKLAPGSEVPEGDKEEVGRLLEDNTKVAFSHLNHSNFNTEVSATFLDVGIGTGAIHVMEAPFTDDVALQFANVPLAELFPEMPPPGKPIISSWRNFRMQIRNIRETWPEAELPDKLEKKANDPKKSFEEVDILIGYLFNEEDRKYYDLVIWDKYLMWHQSFVSKRLIVSRWNVVPGEVFGRGPVMEVLSDIRTANKAKEFILENAALQMSGVYTGVSNGVFNPYTVRIHPGSIIPVASNQTNNPDLAPLPLSGNIQLGDLVLSDLQANIRRALLSQPLGELTDPVRSATEMMIRNQEALRNRGAQIGRLRTEFQEPLFEAVVDILRERGKVADIRVDGQEVTMKFQSPLAQAESIEDFQSSQIWLQSLAAVMPQEVLAGAIKIEDLPGFWAEKLGVDMSLVRGEAERNSLAKTVQEAAETGLEGGL